MKASVIIPNWNGLEYLKICLDSLNKQTFGDFEIIVVDNGSVDGSSEYILKNYPKVKLVKLKTNTGFAYAVNRGIENANSRYLILINNDTEVDKKCIEYLVKAADKRKDVGMIACKMLNFYKRDTIDSAGDYIDVVGHANNLGMGEKDGRKFSEEGYLFLVTGGGCLIKKEVTDDIGLLDEKYFAYMEDVDFCLRAQMSGFKGWFEPKAVVYHIHKATSSRNKPLTEYLQFKNMTATIIKNFPKEVLLKDFNFLKIILVNLNTIIYFAKNGLLIEALKADWYILKNLNYLLSQRKKIQSSMKVNASYIAENIRPKKITFYKFLKKGI